MLDVRLLGPVEVTSSAGPVRLSPTQQLIVAALAMRAPEAVASDELIDLVWGERPPASAAGSLQAQVSRLRSALGKEAILSGDGTYRLGDHRTDVEAVETALQVGFGVGDLPHLTGLFRGRPLGDLGDLTVFRGWRARLDDLRDRFDEQAVSAEVSAGLLGEATARLSLMVERQPLRETWWLQLAELLAGASRRPEALRVLTRCRESFAEAGLEPSAQISALEDVLLDSAEPSSRHLERPELIGRGSELERVAELLEEGRVVTVVGPGGVGKTSLAMAAASDLDLRWCDLSGVDDPGATVAAVARALGAPLVVPFEDSLEAYLRIHPLGLVLDNCEHLAATVATLVERLVRACPGLRVLATSREPLRIAAERVFRLEVLTSAEGRMLFEEGFRRAGGRVGDADQEAVDELVRAVDGLPLAIEMAAARAAAVGIDATLQTIVERVSSLSDSTRTAPDRHRTVAAIVDGSLDLLDAHARCAMFRLASFVGPFDLEAAEAVLESADVHETAALISELVRRSLLEHSGQGRFRMLRTIRERCQERGAEEFVLGVSLHGRHLAAVAERMGTRLFGPDEGHWYDAIDEVIDDLRVATFRALEGGEAALAARITAALLPYAYERLRADVAGWAEAIVALGTPDTREALPMAAVGHIQRGEIETAKELCLRYLAAVGDDTGRGRVRATQMLGDVAMYEGRFDEEIRRGREIISYAAEPERIAERSNGRQHVVFGLAMTGNGDAALIELEELRREAELADSNILRGWVSYFDGEMLGDHDLERAMAAFDDAVAWSSRSDAALLEGVALSAGAALRARQGDTSEASRLFEQAIQRFDERGDLIRMRVAFRNLAVLFVRLGRYEDAAEILGSTLGSDVPDGPEADRLLEARRAIDDNGGDVGYRRGAARTERQTIDAALAALRTVS